MLIAAATDLEDHIRLYQKGIFFLAPYGKALSITLFSIWYPPYSILFKV